MNRKVVRKKVKRMAFYKGGRSDEMDEWTEFGGTTEEHMEISRALPHLPLGSPDYHRAQEKPFWYLPRMSHRELQNRFPMGTNIGFDRVYKKLIYMYPADFIKATGWGAPTGVDRELIRKLMSRRTRVDVPHLIVNEEGLVISHDGRHRAIAARELGMKKIPVVILYDRWDGYRKFMERYPGNTIKQQRARKRTMLDRAMRMVRG